MKLVRPIKHVIAARRAPPGARGLKLAIVDDRAHRLLSRPPGGAWIETLQAMLAGIAMRVAPPRGRVD